MTIDKRRLSFGAQDMFDNLGDDITMRLMKHSGGRYINVPPRYRPEGLYALLVFLTVEELQLLIRHYAGERLLVPKYDKIAKQHRDKRIRAVRAQGVTVDAIAEKFRLTCRQIYTILGEVQPEDANYDLFDGSLGGQF